MFSGDLYDTRSLSFYLLLACVSMLSKLALFMVCFSFCLNWVFFIFIIVSCFFHLEVPWGFWVGCHVCCLAFVVVVDSVVVH